MKITKSLFKTEIEFELRELREIYDFNRIEVILGLSRWLKKYLDYDLFIKKSHQSKE